MTLAYKNSEFHYLRFGNGPRTAICFHGYGEEAEAFAFLEKWAGHLYTFYSIDLPFHGKTQWKDGLDFKPAELLEIVDRILLEKDRNEVTGPRKLTLIGFSLGGRICLHLYQLIPSRVEKLVLLAPDGLKVNNWYWLSTQTWLGNRFFAFTMKHPYWFFSFLKGLNFFRLVNASVFKFVKYYIGDEKVRNLLYKRWTILRNFRPNITAIRQLVKQNNTVVKLIYGKNDRIIFSSAGERFKKEIEEQTTISILHSGHQVLHENHIEEILPALES